MKVGDLRRMRETKSIHDPDRARMAGKLFMIIRIYGGAGADILVDGIIDAGWDLGFLLEHSEAIDVGN